MLKKIRKLGMVLFVIGLVGFIVPEPKVIPVKGATINDWNQDSFWFYPWGSSIVHKGIDIFGAKGTSVVASSHLLVLYSGTLKKGGEVVLGLGPKWRLHYFAHMETRSVHFGNIVAAGTTLGTLGDSGNAANKPPHLHVSIVTLLPYFWRMDDSIHGYKKAFYLNPSEYFQQAIQD